jgi:hypothetical protein
MILSRISKALREQNWVAVAIEFVIVVAGVMLAFQITAWNQSRADREDEAASLRSLHDEMVAEMAVTERIRSLRLANDRHLTSATDILFGRSEVRDFTPEECVALTSSDILYVGRSNLPTLSRLQSTGRLNIVRDRELREALTRLIQTRESLDQSMTIHNYLHDISHLYPDVFEARLNYASGVDGRITQRQVDFTCDQALIFENRGLMNDIARNADGYDAYLRDGLLPWLEQFDRTHAALDRYLGIQHETEAAG